MQLTRSVAVVAGAWAVLWAVLATGCRRSEAAESPATYAAADATIRKAMADPAGWPSYGRDYTNQRFSPLAQIAAGNVSGLQLAWHYKTGVTESFETSPIVVGRTMYITTPRNHLIALDAVTGERRWEYVHPLTSTVACCGPVNRGAAAYAGRIYMATLDAQLVAVDAATGRVAWRTQVANNTRGFSLTLAPLAVAGKIIVGTSGAEYGVRGSVSAYDAGTGKLVWRWYTIPSPDEGGWWGKWAPTDPFGTSLNRDIPQERRDSARYADAWKTGGGSMWQTPAVDTARGLLIMSVGNASPDVDGIVRPGDNLYTNCIVALDLSTGKLKWYMQEIPHDTWDYDAVSPVILFDTRDDSGHTVPAAAEAGKSGWVYVVDRRNGRPIRRSEPFVKQQNMFAKATREGTRVLPGGNGGSEWSPAAYSPITGYMYVLGLNQENVYKLRPEVLRPPASWLSGVWFSVVPKNNNGTFTAVDVATGRIAWQDTMAKPMVGGALATAGGVVFTGTADRKFLALDAANGRTIWTYKAAAGVNAPPVSYSVDGRQYIAVAAGGNFQINAPRGDELLVFALPGKAPTAPPVPPVPPMQTPAGPR